MRRVTYGRNFARVELPGFYKVTRMNDAFAAGALERMTQGGVQLDVVVRHQDGTQWWLRDPRAWSRDSAIEYHYWNPARSVQPVQVGTHRQF